MKVQCPNGHIYTIRKTLTGDSNPEACPICGEVEYITEYNKAFPKVV